MPIYLPPEVDRAWLEPLGELTRHRGEWVPAYTVDGDYRRSITRQSPAMFALVYLSGQLRSRQTQGRTSLAALHLQMAARARGWKRATGRRDAVIAPRKGAKSTWGLVILPMWALAHVWQDFVLGFSDVTEQIRLHMGTFRGALAENDWLRLDYPHLQPAPGMRGRLDTATTYVTRGGQAYAVRGMRARTLGIKILDELPGVLVLDDIEPEEGAYTDRARARVLDLVLHKILPMNEQANVLWLGTTTRWGSLTHALVRAAHGEPPEPWIVDERFDILHVPAIERSHGGLGAPERSFWQERFDLGWLQARRHTRGYLLNYACMPPRPGGRHWRREIFRYTQRRPDELWLFIDPATTVTETSDYTAFVVAGRVDDQVVIEYARAWRLRSTEIRQRAAMICQLNPRITRVAIEGNKADDWAYDVVEPVDLRTGRRVPLHPGVLVDTYRVQGSKKGRIAKLFHEYERVEGPRVLHADAQHVAPLEDQQQAWPDVDHDDLVDVTAALVAELLAPADLD